MMFRCCTPSPHCNHHRTRATMMFRCCTPSPQCNGRDVSILHFASSLQSPPYVPPPGVPSATAMRSKRTADNVGACVKQIIVQTNACSSTITRTHIYLHIYQGMAIRPEGSLSSTRTQTKRPLDNHLHYTRYVNKIYPQNEHPVPMPAVQAFGQVPSIS